MFSLASLQTADVLPFFSVRSDAVWAWKCLSLIFFFLVCLLDFDL